MKIVPIVEDLASKEMPSDPPAVGPTLLLKVMVAHDLGIEVVDFEAGVVCVGFDRLLGAVDEEALNAVS